MKNLDHYCAEAKAYVEKRLKEYMVHEQPMLNHLQAAMNYTLFSGGKRLRPLLCLMVGELFDVKREQLAGAACALEMIHTASLIMDDLPQMDDSKMRRGRPANHLVYGPDVAMLASVGLLMKAYDGVLDDPLLEAGDKVRVVEILTRAVGISGMVGGQFVDLSVPGDSLDASKLEYIQIHKTASMFVASCLIAATIGDAGGVERSAVESYAENLGVAFQILDDIRDATGKANEAGKSVEQERSNAVAVYGVEKSKELVDEYKNKAVDAISFFGEQGDRLVLFGERVMAKL